MKRQRRCYCVSQVSVLDFALRSELSAVQLCERASQRCSGRRATRLTNRSTRSSEPVAIPDVTIPSRYPLISQLDKFDQFFVDARIPERFRASERVVEVKRSWREGECVELIQLGLHMKRLCQFEIVQGRLASTRSDSNTQDSENARETIDVPQRLDSKALSRLEESRIRPDCRVGPRFGWTPEKIHS